MEQQCNETLQARGNDKEERETQEPVTTGIAAAGRMPAAGQPASAAAAANVAGKHALQQLMEVLRSPNTPEQQNQILHILRSNPPLMAAFVKQRQALQEKINLDKLNNLQIV